MDTMYIVIKTTALLSDITSPPVVLNTSVCDIKKKFQMTHTDFYFMTCTNLFLQYTNIEKINVGLNLTYCMTDKITLLNSLYCVLQ
jgi:ABC-type arginine transport system permease subunit